MSWFSYNPETREKTPTARAYHYAKQDMKAALEANFEAVKEIQALVGSTDDDVRGAIARFERRQAVSTAVIQYIGLVITEKNEPAEAIRTMLNHVAP